MRMAAIQDHNRFLYKCPYPIFGRVAERVLRCSGVLRSPESGTTRFAGTAESTRGGMQALGERPMHVRRCEHH
jgi:hypothetical protein